MTNATSARAGLFDRAHAAWPAVPGRLPLTEDSVLRTVRTSDPAVRNLWITQSYADLARRLLDVFQTDQSWCTFAIWASNDAGHSIRGHAWHTIGDDLMPGARRHVDAAVHDADTGNTFWRRLGAIGTLDRSHVEPFVADALGKVSGIVADGNALVFGELAPVFVRVVEAFEADNLPEPGEVDRWLDDQGVPSADACPLVRLAFRHYALAAGADDRDLRAQHVLAGNVAAALHEQQRLQDGLVAALDARLLDVDTDVRGLVRSWVPEPIGRRIAAGVTRRVVPHLEVVWRHVASATLTRLTVPGSGLHLASDVPPTVDDRLPDAAADLLAAVDPTIWTAIGSVAGDRADLHRRMGDIVNLLRSRQRDLSLTVPPFSTAQLAWMVRGEVPPGI